MKQLEVADDANMGKVVIPPKHLKFSEKLLTQAGLGETTMGLTAHHFLAGGLAYLMSHPTNPLLPAEVGGLIKKNRSSFLMLAKTITKNEGGTAVSDEPIKVR